MLGVKVTVVALDWEISSEVIKKKRVVIICGRSLLIWRNRSLSKMKINYKCFHRYRILKELGADHGILKGILGRKMYLFKRETLRYCIFCRLCKNKKKGQNKHTWGGEKMVPNPFFAKVIVKVVSIVAKSALKAYSNTLKSNNNTERICGLLLGNIFYLLWAEF